MARLRRLISQPIVTASIGACAALLARDGAESGRRWWNGRGALAVVDGHPITAADFERALAERGIGKHSGADLRAALDDRITLEVLAANARRAGHDRDGEFHDEVSHLLAGRYRAAAIESEIVRLEVSDAEVEAYYGAHLDEFTLPEAARAAVIFFETPSSASDEQRRVIAARAEGAHRAASEQGGSGHFGPLAVRHSDDQASRYRGGDAGWLAKGQTDSRWENPVVEAIFALSDPGEIAPLVTTRSGLYLIKLLEKKAAEARPLRVVSDKIRQKLLREKRERREAELLAAARARVELRLNEDRIAALDSQGEKLAPAPRRPPAPWTEARR